MDMYRICGRIGQGAYGMVMKAIHKQNKREFALKRITFRRPERMPLAVLREILCLRLLDHRFVVQLKETIVQSIGVILVFDYLPANLLQIIRGHDYILNESEIKSYMLMLLEGLAHIHGLNIMHRDLKPANVLIDNNGILKIADFGLGRMHHPNSSIAYSHQVATRWYRAPELLYSARFYDVGVDLWAVGCIFAEMINRSPLFPGKSDIQQLALVHRILGTPTEEMWPGLSSLPDYKKITFPHCDGRPFVTLMPNSSPDIVDLVSRLVSYNPAVRPPAQEAMYNPYFFSIPLPCPLSNLPKPTETCRNRRICNRRRGERAAALGTAEPLGTAELFEDLERLASLRSSRAVPRKGEHSKSNSSQGHTQKIKAIHKKFSILCHKAKSMGSVICKPKEKINCHESPSLQVLSLTDEACMKRALALPSD